MSLFSKDKSHRGSDYYGPDSDGDDEGDSWSSYGSEPEDSFDPTDGWSEMEDDAASREEDPGDGWIGDDDPGSAEDRTDEPEDDWLSGGADDDFGDGEYGRGYGSGPGARPPAQRQRSPLSPFIKIVAAIALILFIRSAFFSGGSSETPAPAAATAVPTAAPTAVPAAIPTAAPTAAPTAQPVSTNVGSGYLRAQLSGEDQLIYDAMYTTILQRKPVSDRFDCPSDEKLNQVLNWLDLDHPEMFWWSIGGSQFTDYGGAYTFAPNYIFTQQEQDSIQARMDAATASLLSTLRGKSEYDRVKGVYDYLILNTDYIAGPNDQTIWSVLLDHQGVCHAYARTTQYLLNKLDMECILVSGYAGEAHSWNIVKIDGDWYQLDATWGDPVKDNGEPGNDLNYAYFCLTTEEMYRDHTPDIDYQIPWCTATACNYYIHEGRYFTRYDQDALYALLNRDYQAGRPCEFRMADEASYREAKRRLIDDVGICRAVPVNSFYFSTNDNLHIITIFF